MQTRSRSMVPLALGLTAALLYGCGSTTAATPTSAPATSAPASAAAGGSAAPSAGAVPSAGTDGVDAAARALLPKDIIAKGELVDGVNLPNPPMEFTDAGASTPKGLDIDLATALGRRLGLTVKFDNVQFDQLLPGLATKRDDMILSALSDTAERQKVATWID